MGPFLVLASEPCMGHIARYFPALRRASCFFKRFRSKTLSPPYLAFQLYNV
jgi:hypothetical protein